MKASHLKIILAAGLALTGGFFAAAQSTGIPGATDYAQFSRFISDRNIFDPSRYPHTRTGYVRPKRPQYTQRRSSGEPQFTLVGTMAYEKGMFAFFDGNNYELKKVLELNGDVAGYTVTEITLTSVEMQGPDKRQFQMKVGDQMRQESGQWQFAAQGEASGYGGRDSSSRSTESTATDTTATSPTPADTSSAAPSAALESNDILKRLMEKRAKEDQ